MNSTDLDVTGIVSPIYLTRLKNGLGHLMKDLELMWYLWITKSIWQSSTQKTYQ